MAGREEGINVGANHLLAFPPEILTLIFAELPVATIASLAQTCSVLYELSRDNHIWEQKILRDFKIDIVKDKTNQSDPSEGDQGDQEAFQTPYNFYRWILFKYGKSIGLWQRQTLGFYGSLVQISYENWSLKCFEWVPPKNPEIQENMRTLNFFTLTLDPKSKDKVRYKIMDSWYHQEFDDSARSVAENEDEEMILVIDKEGKKLSVYPRPLPDFTEQPQLWQNLLLRYVNLETGQNFSTQEEMMANNMHDIGSYVAKFITRFNCRAVHGFLRPEPRSAWDLSSRSVHDRGQDWPIPSGVFKGTYGPHGIEMISLHYANNNTQLRGVKLTGDPNVPFGKVSFQADLDKSIIMSEDVQRDATCDQLIEAVESLTFTAGRDSDTNQPFVMPEDAFQRREISFTRASHRFIGDAQVAGSNYTSPEFIPAHIVIFDCDNFGVIFLALRSMSMYARVKEDFGAVHHDDIFSAIST